MIVMNVQLNTHTYIINKHRNTHEGNQYSNDEIYIIVSVSLTLPHVRTLLRETFVYLFSLHYYLPFFLRISHVLNYCYLLLFRDWHSCGPFLELLLPFAGALFT